MAARCVPEAGGFTDYNAYHESEAAVDEKARRAHPNAFRLPPSTIRVPSECHLSAIRVPSECRESGLRAPC